MTFRGAKAAVLAAMLALAGPAGAQTFAPAANPRNMLIGGDFSTNPWQRGTAFAAIGATPIFTADRFFAYALAGQTAAVARVAVVSSVLTGFNQALRVTRTAGNISLAPVCVGQIVESASALAAAGQPSTFSIYLAAAANFSALNALVTVTVGTGTGIDEGAAKALSPGWTGISAPLSATQAITAGFKRFSFPVTIPTDTQEISVTVCFTPVGTAGALDGFLIDGAQFELGDLTQFERRPVGVELFLSQRFLFSMWESAVGRECNGQAFNGFSVNIICSLPTTMRVPPTVIGTVGGWTVTDAAASGVRITSISPVAGLSTIRVGSFNVGVAAGMTAGAASQFIGSGGGGQILFDAELN